MRTCTQAMAAASPGSGVANRHFQPRTHLQVIERKGRVRGVRGLLRNQASAMRNHSVSSAMFQTTLKNDFNPGHPGLEAKNKGFLASPGFKSTQMQPRTPDSRVRARWAAWGKSSVATYAVLYSQSISGIDEPGRRHRMVSLTEEPP